MALNETQQLNKLLEQSHYVLVVFKPEFNVDAICSALAWKNFLEKQHKQVDVISGDFTQPKNLKFLEGIEQIKPNIAHLQKFTIKVDVSSAKIDSLSYDIKDDWLSIHLNPKEGIITKNELRTAQSAFKYDLIITINTQDLESLGDTFLNNTDLFYRIPIINIDHNSSNEHFGQINNVDLNCSSTSENIFKVMKLINETDIDKNIATSLLTGIISKTRSFKSINITPNTLNAASELMKIGADRQKIIRHLYYSRSIASLKIWGQALTHLQSEPDIGLVWTCVTRDDFIRSNASEQELDDLIHELIINSPEAKVIVLLYEMPNGSTSTKIRGIVVTDENNDAKSLIQAFEPQGNKKRAWFVVEGKALKEMENIVLENIRTTLEHLNT